MDKRQIISRDPEVMNGALVFAGTRVPVEILVQHRAADDTLDKFLDDFPRALIRLLAPEYEARTVGH